MKSRDWLLECSRVHLFLTSRYFGIFQWFNFILNNSEYYKILQDISYTSRYFADFIIFQGVCNYILKYFRIWQKLQNISGYFKVLQDIPKYVRFYLMYFEKFQDTSGYVKILQNILRYFRIFQNIREYLKVLQSIPKYFMIFQVTLGYSKNFIFYSRYFRIFQNTSEYFKVFPDISMFSGCSKILHDISSYFKIY